MSLAKTLVFFQIAMTVVSHPGKAPSSSSIAESLGQFCGHSLNLVPGDYQYEPPEFTIVIGWNGIDHFYPTELVSPKEVYEWKLALTHKYLVGAVSLFNEIEHEVLEEEDKVVVDSMKELRDQMEVTQQILKSRSRSKEHAVPPVTIHSQKKTAMTKEIAQDYVPVPLLRHSIREIDLENRPAKSTQHPVAPTKLFPDIQMGPALLQSDFTVPESLKKDPKRPAPEEEEEEPPKKTRRSTRSASKAGKEHKGASLPVTLSLTPPSQSVPPTAVVPGKPAKKYICAQCGYTTDRKHDFENHMNQHTGIQYSCSHCNKVFYSQGSMKQHIQTTHLNIKRARCPYVDCHFEDKDFGKLIVHKYDAHGEGKSSKCQSCGRKFDNWRSFTRHQRTCGREKDKTCPVPHCRKQYKDLDKLTKHMQTAHLGSSYSPSICDQCGKVFKNADSLRTHQAGNCK